MAGKITPNLVAGLAYSIALNYLNRVVRGRKIGNVIYFQGGTAYNDAVTAAFAVSWQDACPVQRRHGHIGGLVGGNSIYYRRGRCSAGMICRGSA
jgi:activator of 2-hydroxyglutaryl-CoA dehydratase